MNRILWIAWEKQQRSTVLANELGADLHQLEVNYPRPLRYLVLTIKTTIIFFRKKYDYVFVQNPSIILSFEIILLNLFFKRRKIIIDAHTPYLKLKGLVKIIFQTLESIINKNADLVIVTNLNLKKKYEERFPKAQFFVLPDKIPDIKTTDIIEFETKNNIALICTYSEDEPYIEAFKALGILKKYNLYVTGKKIYISKQALSIMPNNIFLTDFLSNKDYNKLLNSVDAVMVLTTIEDNMLCGAYESVAVEKPLITSKKTVLEEYFDIGVIHVDNSAVSIAQGIEKCFSKYDKYCSDIIVLKVFRKKEWHAQWNALLSFLGISVEV